MRPAYRHDQQRPMGGGGGGKASQSDLFDEGDNSRNGRYSYTYNDVVNGEGAVASSSSPSSSSISGVPRSYKHHLQQQQQRATHSQHTSGRQTASASAASIASSDSPSSAQTPSGVLGGGGGDNGRYHSSRSDSHVSPAQATTPQQQQQPQQQPQESSDGSAKKRRRIQQACKACSFRRVKCNGQCPCQTCIKNGDDCVYGQAKKRGPAKGTTRGGKKSAGLTREAASDRSQDSQRRSLTRDSRSDLRYESSSSGLPFAHPDAHPAAGRQQAGRDLYAPGPSRSGDAYMPAPSLTNEQHALGYDPTVTFSDARVRQPPLPPPARRDVNTWDDGTRRNAPSFGQHPPSQSFLHHHDDNIPYGSPPIEQIPPPYHPQRDAGSGYAPQTWTEYAPAPLPPPPQQHGEYALHSLSRDLKPQSASSPRVNARGAPPAGLPASNAPAPHRQHAAIPYGNGGGDGAGHGVPLNRTNAVGASSPRPAHLVPPGPAMHQQPNRSNPARITSKSDVNSDELADLVLKQVYHERQQARRSNDKKDSVGGGSGNEDWASFSAVANSANDDTAPDGSNAPAVTDEIRDRLFLVFWNVTSLHWPMFPRQAFPTVEEFRRHVEARHPLLVNAIFSIASLTWDVNRDGGMLDTRPDNEALSTRELSTIFSLRAHYHHIAAVLSPSLESTAAMVLLSLRETGAGRPSQAAHYCWTACRMAMDLSLHRHAEMAQIMGASFTPAQDEMRRRIYWSVYVIDKMMAVQLGRPPVLRDGESDCPLPSFAGDSAVYTWSSLPQNFFSDALNRKMGPQPLTVALYFTNGCRLACISEGIIAQYNVVKHKQSDGPSTAVPSGVTRDNVDWQRDVAVLHQRLVEWERNTPPNLKWESKAAESYFPFVIHQQVWAQALKILLHRPYILKPTDAASGLNSHAECSKATNIIWQMFIKHKELYGLRRVPSSMVYCLFSAATIALANTTSTDPDVSGKAKEQLTFCVEWFIDIMETWASATQHLAILQNLASTVNVNLAETGLQGEALHEKIQQKMSASGSWEKLHAGPGFRQQPEGGAVASSGGGVWAATPLSSSTKPLAAVHSGGGGGGGNTPSQGASLPWTTTQAMPSTADASKFSSGASDTALSGVDSTVSTAAATDKISGGGAEQLQSLDAFWPDMPLGEDFQRWLSFTHTYFSVLGNNGGGGGGGGGGGTTATPVTTMTAASSITSTAPLDSDAGPLHPHHPHISHPPPPPSSFSSTSDSFYPAPPFSTISSA